MPVVLVHGLGVSSRYMIPAGEALASRFHVYLPDLPGFGRSDKPSHVYTIGELTRALAAWMDAMHLNRAVFLGNSFGCQIIAELAVRDPERVERAILVGPSVDPARRTAPQQLMRLAIDAFREPPSLIPIVAYDYLVAGPVRVLKTFLLLLEDRIEEKLRKMNQPTLVVRGSRDPIVPQDWAEYAVRLLREGELAVIPGEAHAVHYSAPQKVVRVARPYLLA